MSKFRRILLVDDDEVTNFINQSLVAELQLADHIEALTEAEKALKLLEERCPEQNCPDLIFLDLKMPVFDGFDFLEGFNQLPTHQTQAIQLIILTTSSNPKDLQRLEALGMYKLINKPLTEEKILSALPSIS